MPLPTYEAAAGVARDIDVTLIDPDTGEAYATNRWAPGDTLTAACWRGDDQASSFTPTPTWVSAAAGTMRVTIAGASTTSLAPGRYLIRVTATDVSDANRVFEVWRANLDLLASPGSGTTPDVYGTYDDMRRVAGAWLADLQESGSDQTGFAEQRGAARAWFDGILQRHYRRDTGVARQDSLDHLLVGIGARYGEHDTTLQDWLDDDRLVLTTPAGKRIVECVSRYAVALVCEAQISGKPDDVWRDRARMFRSRAQNDVASITAEIDTTTVADGVGDLVIDLGTADRLRA